MPIDRETYPSLDAVGLTQAVADGETTAEQLLDLARSRHDQVNPEINAVVSWFDQPVFRSVSPDVVPGPLHGVPFLLKDLGHDLVGHPTSRGSRALRLVVPRENSTVVERWLDAGLVITGKTNTPEFGAKGITESELFGPARNPWNTDHSPGGSSGGAAAAVAAGIVPCAGASDGGGSIRIPASCCGLFGLKASRGLIAGGPAAAEKLGGTATDGAISWSVRDTALMLDVLAGPAPASPFAAAMPAEPFSDQVGRDPGRLRIAWCATSSITEPDDEAVRAVRSTAELLAGLGHEVVELDRQPIDDAAMLKDFLATWFVYIAREVELAKFAGAATDDAFEEDTRLMAALGRATPSLELLALIDARQQHVRRLADFHSEHDLLLTPTTATPAPRIGALADPPLQQHLKRLVMRSGTANLLRRSGLVDRAVQANLGWVPYTQLANVTGRPAMTVPLHITAGGLPIGSQFVGRLGAEPVMLRLAGQLEASRPWAQHLPGRFGSVKV